MPTPRACSPSRPQRLISALGGQGFNDCIIRGMQSFVVVLSIHRTIQTVVGRRIGFMNGSVPPLSFAVPCKPVCAPCASGALRWGPLTPGGAHECEYAHDRRFGGDAQAPQNLHAAVHHSASEQATLARLDSKPPFWPWSSSQAVCQVRRRAVCRSMSLTASMQPTPSCSVEFAKGMAAAGAVEGDIVVAAGLAQPAHAVRQACRGESNLGVSKALAHFAQHLVGGRAQVVKAQHAVAAGDAVVHRVHAAF